MFYHVIALQQALTQSQHIDENIVNLPLVMWLYCWSCDLDYLFHPPYATAGALASTLFMPCLQPQLTHDWLEQLLTRHALFVLLEGVPSTTRDSLCPTSVDPAAHCLAWVLASCNSSLFPTTPPLSLGQNQTYFPQLQLLPLLELQWVLRPHLSSLPLSKVPFQSHLLCLRDTMRSMSRRWTCSVRGWLLMWLMVSDDT